MVRKGRRWKIMRREREGFRTCKYVYECCSIHLQEIQLQDLFTKNDILTRLIIRVRMERQCTRTNKLGSKKQKTKWTEETS